MDRSGRLQFYPASTPLPGEMIAVSYRTSRRSVARLASAAVSLLKARRRVAGNGLLDGNGHSAGCAQFRRLRKCGQRDSGGFGQTAPRHGRASTPSGTRNSRDDVWPGDVLAVTSASADLNASLVVREVQIDVLSGAPNRTKYTISLPMTGPMRLRSAHRPPFLPMRGCRAAGDGDPARESELARGHIDYRQRDPDFRGRDGSLRAEDSKSAGVTGRSHRDPGRIWFCALRCRISPFHGRPRWSGTTSACTTDRLRRTIPAFRAPSLSICRLRELVMFGQRAWHPESAKRSDPQKQRKRNHDRF